MLLSLISPEVDALMYNIDNYCVSMRELEAFLDIRRTAPPAICSTIMIYEAVNLGRKNVLNKL
jgi:hypothetical protein